jgi:5'-deoxynucleotidase
MRLINRWGLMRNTIPENIQEHSLQVAVIAHALAVVRAKYFAAGRPAVDENRIALLAIYHDASEILTGDLPTPVKYFNPAIHDAYKAVESVAMRKLLSMLPDDLAMHWAPVLEPDTEDPSIAATMQLIKAADKISAYIKCIEEEKAGNSEFRQAAQSTMATLCRIATELPEVEYFLQYFVPAFSLSLDELQ